MLKKKSNSTEKKRKHSQSEERHDGSKRRSTDANTELAALKLDPDLDGNPPIHPSALPPWNSATPSERRGADPFTMPQQKQFQKQLNLTHLLRHKILQSILLLSLHTDCVNIECSPQHAHA